MKEDIREHFKRYLDLHAVLAAFFHTPLPAPVAGLKFVTQCRSVIGTLSDLRNFHPVTFL